MKKIYKHFKKEWYKYGLETLVVIVGVLMAFALNDWNENRKNQLSETSYLLELLEDFKENQREYLQDLKTLETIADAMVTLLEQSALDQPTMSTAELNNAFKYIQVNPYYNDANRAYSNLTGSGNLNLLTSRELRNMLAIYYSEMTGLMSVQSINDLELAQNLRPYIIKNMDYQAVYSTRFRDNKLLPKAVDEDYILKVLNEREFRNVITAKWELTTDLIYKHEQLNTLRNEVIKELEKEIEKL